MKKVTLLALKKDKHRLFKAMQRLGCVQVTQAEDDEAAHIDEANQEKANSLQKTIARLDLAIARLSAYDKNKPGMLSLKPVANADQVAATVAASSEIMSYVDEVEKIERTRVELKTREARETSMLEQLYPWGFLDIPLNKLGETKFAVTELASIPSREYEAFQNDLREIGQCELEEVSNVRETVNLFIAYHKDVKEQVDEAMRARSATRVTFDGIEGTVALAIDQANGRLNRIEEVRRELQVQLEKLAGHLAEIRLLRDIEATERDLAESASRCLDTHSAFVMTGWVEEDRIEKLEAEIKKIEPEAQIEFADPADDETPPTLMKNNDFVSPFESIVKMFAMPDPRGLDPTAIMLPFWICYFGMMLSDAGYGVLLGIAGGFIWYKLRNQGIGKMAFIISLGGLATVFWGSIYGCWFGETVGHPIINPMNDAITLLLVCVAAGAVHLLTGLGIAAYMNIKRGKPWDALFDQGFWVLLLAGLGLMLVAGTAGQIVAIIGAAGIIATGGRGKNGNIISKIVGGFASLYGVTGYLSDLLSYARLFGMGLATGVIGMVVNMLAGLIMTSPVGIALGCVVLLFGHSLNLAINTLGAYVHSCRLQFIEFFGKFYESGGTDFSPLENKTRYVNIAN
ncbi:MAG: V-type ATP synthase subunit I [Clostridia bacterium]|nr:V-type ATP synthase subunit I [Clostridia bacterium]